MAGSYFHIDSITQIGACCDNTFNEYAKNSFCVKLRTQQERCVSGLNGNPGKVVYRKRYREFESPSLRKRPAKARKDFGGLSLRERGRFESRRREADISRDRCRGRVVKILF